MSFKSQRNFFPSLICPLFTSTVLIFSELTSGKNSSNCNKIWVCWKFTDREIRYCHHYAHMSPPFFECSNFNILLNTIKNFWIVRNLLKICFLFTFSCCHRIVVLSSFLPLLGKHLTSQILSENLSKIKSISEIKWEGDANKRCRQWLFAKNSKYQSFTTNAATIAKLFEKLISVADNKWNVRSRLPPVSASRTPPPLLCHDARNGCSRWSMQIEYRSMLRLHAVHINPWNERSLFNRNVIITVVAYTYIFSFLLIIKPSNITSKQSAHCMKLQSLSWLKWYGK